MSTDQPAGIELRPATTEELPRLITTTERAFGKDVRPDDLARDVAEMRAERTLAAFDGDDLVASAGIWTFDMTLPGGPAPVAGVSIVGVLPTHRRRGILSAMMRRQLTELHDTDAEPVAALWASEPAIYRRFGYGLASQRLHLTVDSQLRYAAGAPVGPPLRLVDAQGARDTVSRIYEQLRTTRPGLLTRSSVRWDGIFDDSDAAKDGASSLQCALLDSGDGYVLYRTKGTWENWRPDGKVLVHELIAADAAGHAALWRYLVDMDLMTTVDAWNRPVDDPLLHFVVDTRRTHPRLADGLWLRIVDVERALAARTYSAADSLVVEVRDDNCPWNAGSFLIDVDGPESRGVKVTRTDRSADLTMSAVELGSAYLGGTRLRSLAAAGFVDEHTAGAVARADRLFAGAVEPWCAEVF